MTSRHNETVLARREKLRAQQKAELEAARQRHSQQAAALAAVDRELALLEESRARTRRAVAAAAELFNNEQELADLVQLSLKDIRVILREHAESQQKVVRQASAPSETSGTHVEAVPAAETSEADATAAIPGQSAIEA